MRVSSPAWVHRVTRSLRDWFSPRTLTLNGVGERVRRVRMATSIGIVICTLFSLFNMVIADTMALGLLELAIVFFLLVPAALVSRIEARIELSETLLLLAAMVGFAALIVFDGTQGTGLFWVFTVPFLCFFLKTQKQGWLYSLSFLALACVYLIWIAPNLAYVQQYSTVVTTHFLLSLGFYIVVSAAFNHIRTRHEEQLRQGKLQAEAAVRAKSRFISAASHDLRQPAHALGLFVARLSQLPHDARTQALVTGVDASVRGLQQMLDDFFDYSRLDAPAMKVTTRAFPIERVFEQLRIGFSGQAAAERSAPAPARLAGLGAK